MNIRGEPERNSKTEIKRKDTVKDGFGCGMRGWERELRKE